MQPVPNRDLATAGDLTALLVEALRDPRRTERLPVGRTGERAEIVRDVRRLIHRRDGWRCLWCGWRATRQFDGTWSTDRMLQLDHIEPWSAGGSDRSDNLRTLCSDCNTTRSNERADMDLVRRPLPVVYWCVPCWADFAYPSLGEDGYPLEDRPDVHQMPQDAVSVFCGQRNHQSWTLGTWELL